MACPVFDDGVPLAVLYRLQRFFDSVLFDTHDHKREKARMANWYYYDDNGQKHGPVRGRQLKSLARQGIITAETFLETEEGQVILAGKAAGLNFTEAVLPKPPPLAEVNPFATVLPGADDPHILPMSEPQLSTMNSFQKSRMRVKSKISCPHCWHEFSTDQILFVSESPDLLGDIKLGDIEQMRFLPHRFDLDGAALDLREIPCHKLACPNCHLKIPRSLLGTSNLFISIAGAPASGKSYFFTSMVWQLRKTMTQYFCMTFTDADPEMNKRIREYEMMQFLGGDDPNKPVAIEKTDVQGDIYNNTLIDGNLTSLAQPFSFTITPLPSHPFPQYTEQVSQTVCMYDNAGESFLPGVDHLAQPVTRHLLASDVILFLFDPTQDVRFKAACKIPVDDPQMDSSSTADVRRSKVNQCTVLTEMITRIKTHSRLMASEKIKTPLIIVLTKLDAWLQLVDFPNFYHPWYSTQDSPLHIYNAPQVEQSSQILRKLLLDLIPDLVGTAERHATNVVYTAVSATGTAPELGEPDQDGKRSLLYRPINLKPIWVTVPFFHAQFVAKKYCVPIHKEK